ncbi:hypothetical protein FQR65_LT16029 [Abscondita terminalis]|nr:hypothetical protein FQR65_LT16029 [Abscondita terminalis]
MFLRSYNITLPYGSYTTAELSALGVANNDVSGIKVPMTGVRVRLYDQDNFAGTPLLMTTSADCLAGSYGFNDKTSSVIVEPYGGGGSAKFYKTLQLCGYEVELPVGGYTTAELIVKNYKKFILAAMTTMLSRVLIPTTDRMTACVSSQVGCSLTCKFCATGYMDRKRNLNADEIYDQVVLISKQAEEKYGQPLTNIVYMGMGEPLLNYANMMKSVERITSSDGLNMAAKR